MTGPWKPPGKSRAELWWERRPLWLRGVVLGIFLSAMQLVWAVHRGIVWWEWLLVVGYAIAYPFGYVRGKLHPRMAEPMDAERKLRLRLFGAWGAGLAVALLLAYVGTFTEPGSPLIGAVSGVVLGTAVGSLVWVMSR